MSHAVFDLLELQRLRLTNELRHREDISVERLPDYVDDQVASENREISSQKLSNSSEELKDTVRAQEKLRENTYGQCDDCEGDIKPIRLKANFAAIRCIPCQEIHERRKQLLEDRRPRFY